MDGWGQGLQGEPEAGIAQIYQGLASCRTIGAEFFRSYFLCLLADVYGRSGQTQAGLDVIGEALASVEQTSERFCEAEIYRLNGTLLLLQSTDNQSEAEASFHQSLDISRRQQSKSLELRAALSLSQLWQQQGKREAARDMLASILSWFTEGFDTADLQEAKTLLSELEV